MTRSAAAVLSVAFLGLFVILATVVGGLLLLGRMRIAWTHFHPATVAFTLSFADPQPREIVFAPWPGPLPCCTGVNPSVRTEGFTSSGKSPRVRLWHCPEATCVSHKSVGP